MVPNEISYWSHLGLEILKRLPLIQSSHTHTHTRVVNLILKSNLFLSRNYDSDMPSNVSIGCMDIYIYIYKKKKKKKKKKNKASRNNGCASNRDF